MTPPLGFEFCMFVAGWRHAFLSGILLLLLLLRYFFISFYAGFYKEAAGSREGCSAWRVHQRSQFWSHQNPKPRPENQENQKNRSEKGKH